MISSVYRTVVTSLLFQSTGMQLSLTLRMTAKEGAGFMSRTLEFTSEGFPSIEKALGRTYLRLLRVIARGRPAAERRKDPKCSVNFILS